MRLHLQPAVTGSATMTPLPGLCVELNAWRAEVGGKMLCTLHWEAQSLAQEEDGGSLQGTGFAKFFNLYLNEPGEGPAAVLGAARCLVWNVRLNTV